VARVKANIQQGEAAPFLKWAGGKSKLLGQLRALMPSGPLRYGEPFFGGGAMFFALWRDEVLQHAVVSDASTDIVNACEVVRSQLQPLLTALRRHERAYLAADARGRSDYFYAVRSQHPAVVELTPVERAARMLFLNRTCFNGLWRENSRGLFNAPHGRYANPAIVMEDRLRAAGRALADAHLLQTDFRGWPELARTHGLDFVYLDPPYHPLSPTSSFNAYSGGQFHAQAQRDLAEVCAQLDRQGVRWLLSNSDCAFVRETWSRWQIRTVRCARAVNSRADRRGEVNEVAVTNY
jgi:DNA adenine methylase